MFRSGSPNRNMMIIKKIYYSITYFCLFIITFLPGIADAQNTSARMNDNLQAGQWVDSVYSALTPQERIGQLMMIRVKSTGDSTEYRDVANLIRQYNLGGLCFFQGGPVRQAMLTNYYQSLAKTPVFISMDAEWGLGMRLDSTISFARAMTLGAIQDTALVAECGYQVGLQLKRMGVHIDFAPVADINSNPANPIINIRSFGENVDNVIIKSLSFNRGLRKSVLTVAKHFPGHGDTDTDSHLALPVMQHSLETLEQLDMKPFKALEPHVDGVMVGHLYVPALDSTSGLPASLSPVIVDSILHKQMNFKGLVFTDALDMRGVADYAGPGDAEVKALLAGSDILLLPQSVPQAVKAIQTDIDSGEIAPSMLEERCKRVLRAKYDFGLRSKDATFVKTENLAADLNNPEAELLNSRLYENSITLLANFDNIIPLQHPNVLKIACLTVGTELPGAFEDRVDSYIRADHFYCPREPDKLRVRELLQQLKPYQLVIVDVRNTHPSPSKGFGISDNAALLVDSVMAAMPVILDVFSIPYSIGRFRNVKSARAVLISYQDNPVAHDISAQLIFGAVGAKGQIPVTASPDFALNAGLKSESNLRLRYSLPEAAGLSTAKLALVDSIATEGLRADAYPGCQVLIARNGTVIYRKSFGYHDYYKQQKVKNADIYDLASITKVAATTISVMRLYDQGLIDINKPLSKYLPALQHTNKHGILIRDIMAHQGRLKEWIPFYRKTLKNSLPDSAYYRKDRSDQFNVQVADSMFLRSDYPSRIIDSIIRSDLLTKKEYKYSDLGFILLGKTIETITKQKLEDYVMQNFYKPLNINMGYLPLERFSLQQITPTENDTVFRHQLIHGHVHDQAAAMFGGVAGHAGLFGNANDLAVLFQMLLQKGEYAGRTYIDSSTVRLFTTQQFEGNRRGLGFDKPQLDRNADGPACPSASGQSFGHTGFTGTYVWADPEQQLIIVFLSNRINPDAENTKLAQLGIRTRIQQAVYNAITDHKLISTGNQNR